MKINLNRQRQTEAIRSARERGVYLGGAKYALPDNFDDIAKKYRNYEITNIEAATILNMNRSTF